MQNEVYDEIDEELLRIARAFKEAGLVKCCTTTKQVMDFIVHVLGESEVNRLKSMIKKLSTN